MSSLSAVPLPGLPLWHPNYLITAMVFCIALLPITSPMNNFLGYLRRQISGKFHW